MLTQLENFFFTQLRKLGILPPDENLPSSCKRIFQVLWANNGDAISRQYAGTAALKVSVEKRMFNIQTSIHRISGYVLLFFIASLNRNSASWNITGNLYNRSNISNCCYLYRCTTRLHVVPFIVDAIMKTMMHVSCRIFWKQLLISDWKYVS